MPTIAHLSDLHLQSGVPARQVQVEPILEKINEMKPDLVVISGDVTDDGWDSIEELQWAKAWLEQRIDSDWFAVAGNHDIGNFVNLEKGKINEDRWGNWFNTFGGCTRSSAGERWQLHFIHVMMLGSGIEYESVQEDWLGERLALSTPSDLHTVLTLHTPLCINAVIEETNQRTDYWLGPAEARKHLLHRILDTSTRLVCSGHVHQSRIQDIEGIRFAWAPPASGTWVHAPGLPNPPMPEQTGFFLHHLHDDGTVESELIECAPMLKLYEHHPGP